MCVCVCVCVCVVTYRVLELINLYINIRTAKLIFFQESNKVTKVTSFWLDRFLFQVGCGTLKSAKRSCIALLSFTDKSGSLIAPINYIYPDALKNVDVPVANVTVSGLISVAYKIRYITDIVQ